MEIINILYSILILSAIIVPIALYKRSKIVKFRLIETRYTYDQSSYTPQVRIGGIWYYIITAYVSGKDMYYIHTYDVGYSKIDAHDAVMIIENFKSAGNFSIDSNRKLNSNQKSIIIEDLIEN